jgi:DNA-nicking Smr family endonuclease
MKRQKPKISTIEIDLHGLNLTEAKAECDSRLSGVVNSTRAGIKVRIITGKGRHSQGGEGTLIKHIYSHVLKCWSSQIKKIDEDPDLLRIDGLPIRGHFDVTFK